MIRIRKEMVKGLLYDTGILDNIKDAVYVQLEENTTIYDYGVYQRTLNIFNKEGKPVYILRSGFYLRCFPLFAIEYVQFYYKKCQTSSISHHILSGIELNQNLEEGTRIEMLLRPAEGSLLLLHMNNSLKGEDIFGIAQQLAATIILLHQCGWSYNDIQPDNITLAKGVATIAKVCSYVMINLEFSEYAFPQNAIAMIIKHANNKYLPPAALAFRTQQRLWHDPQGMTSS